MEIGDEFPLKRNLGVTMHFSEIIKLQFDKKKKCHALLCILALFRILMFLN